MPLPALLAPLLVSAGGGLLGRLLGGRGDRLPAPSFSPQQILGIAQQGPTEQERRMVAQIQDLLFQQGAQGIQDQAGKLSATLSGSAAARGLGKSSIGLGQQGLLGQQVTRSLGNLQTGLQAGGLQQLLQLPQQRAGLAAQLFGAETGLRGQQFAANQQRGSGLFSVLGSLLSNPQLFQSLGLGGTGNATRS